MEEMRKNKEYINQLIRLLKFAIQERDEARNHFQKLLNKTMPLNDVVPLFQPNSSITESNSLSEPHNYSSPVDSLFDAVSSPEFSNINLLPNQINSSEIDQESLIIDTLAKGRVLPQKGKLLQAVLQAGPLLQPLMMAGPLPRWRNPPQMHPFQIPPVSIKGCEDTRSLIPPPFSAQPQSSSAPPMFNFGSSGNCGSSASLMNVNSYSPLAKRQRFG